MRSRRVVLVLVMVVVGALLAGGCRGGDEGRYEFYLVGTVIYRCDKVSGACVGGRAGEAGTYAVLPPAGTRKEAWAAEEGLVVELEGEGR